MIRMAKKSWLSEPIVVTVPTRIKVKCPVEGCGNLMVVSYVKKKNESPPDITCEGCGTKLRLKRTEPNPK